MAHTGALAMAASVADSVTSMDLASRFRRQHRPPLTELFPEPVAEHQLGFNEDSPSRLGLPTIRSYRNSVLSEGASTTLSPELTNCAVDDWDMISEFDICSEAGGLDKSACADMADTDILDDSGCHLHQVASTSRKHHHRFARSCLPGESMKDPQFGVSMMSIACLDSSSRFRRYKRTKSTMGRRRADVCTGAVEQEIRAELAADVQRTLEVSDQTTPHSDGAEDSHIEDVEIDSWMSRFPSAASSSLSTTSVIDISPLSLIACLFDEAPRSFQGSFTSINDVKSAAQLAMTGDVEERCAARLFLLCAMCFMVMLGLCCGCVLLVVFAFAAHPEPVIVPVHEEQRYDDGGIVDARAQPKSITRVLAVVMISLFAGNGLAAAHPVRDALLHGM